MIMEDKGLLGKIVAIIPGLVLMIGTLAVLRMYAVPWLNGITLFGVKGWPVKVLSLNYLAFHYCGHAVSQRFVWRQDSRVGGCGLSHNPPVY